MATKITTGLIDSGAITSALITDGSITATDLHTTLDLTGKTVTVATATAGDNDTSVASTAYVDVAIANLADSAPSTLDTLNELAAALGDDANYATTTTNAIAAKLPLAGGTLTGNLLIGTTDAGYPAYGDELTIGSASGNNGMTIRSGTSNYGTFYFSDATGNGAGTYAGKLQYNHSDNSMVLATNSVNRLTIDSSGNVMVGTTDALPASNNDANGIAFRADGGAQFSRNAATGVRFNRGTSDGDITDFHKAGTKVGSIGTNGGYIYVGSGDTNLRFHAGADAILPANAGGASRSAAIDLGTSGAKFKDLYLSGIASIGNLQINGGQGSDGQVLTSTGSGIAWEDVDSVTKSNSAPGSPAAGDLWFNTSSSTASGIRAKGLAVYSGTAWELMNSLFSATGGTITTSGAYTIHTFTSSGTFTPNGANSVDWLVVAGGGGGGGNPSSDSGGGGGAGGFRTGTGLGVTATAYTVTVGAGGAGGAQQNGAAGNGAKGGNSSFGSISSTGGGFGGGPGHTNSGGPGGSGGGGGSGYNTGSTNGDPGAGNEGGYSPVEGYAGTPTTYSYYWTAGGGGSASGSPTYYAPVAGVANSYSGSSVTYAEGGDGQGGIVSVANTGNGGDGGGNAAANGRAGGSGIVIIRYTT